MQVNACVDGRPLLTIAIPTYNRAIFLDLCLNRVSKELDSLSADQQKLVRIYVSNNASMDSTIEVISKYQLSAVIEFEVVHNPENIGAEQNVAQCYTSAKTHYVWVLGDDDVILPGGLSKVLDVLTRQHVDVLYVNNYWFKDDYRDSPSHSVNRGVETCRSSIDFARRTNVMLTFISGLIVKTGIDLKLYANIVEGCNLPQMGWVLPLLRDGECFAIIDDWVVAAKGSNSGGYGLIEVFGNNLQKIAAGILKDNPDMVRAIENGTIVNFFTSSILEIRKGSSNFLEEDAAISLKKAFGDNWRYYVFLVPLIRLPLPLIKFYNILLMVFRRFFPSVLV